MRKNEGKCDSIFISLLPLWINCLLFFSSTSSSSEEGGGRRRTTEDDDDGARLFFFFLFFFDDLYITNAISGLRRGFESPLSWAQKTAAEGCQRGDGEDDVRSRRACCVLVVAALAATREDLDAALDHKEDAVRDFKASLESAARDINLYNSTCEIATPRAAPNCVTRFTTFNYGNTRGCGCNEGRTIDARNSVLKTSPKLGASSCSVKRTACRKRNTSTPT